MKKNIKIIVLIIFALILIGTTKVCAASASISASKTNVTVGESVTITVSINAATWNVSVSGSGISDSIVGYNEDAVNQNKTKQYTLNTTQAGTYTVSISGDITDQSKDSSDKVSKSVTITASAPAPVTPTEPTKPTTPSTPSNNNTTKPNTNNTSKTVKKSDNSNLSSIQIAEGVISPEFSKTVKEYIVNVPYEVTKLSIAATPEHSKGTVTINGNDELKVGENLIEIIVTAEDSSTDKYTIKAIRAKQELSLQTLSIYYVNENGEKVELKLDPQFSFDVYSYSVNDILAHTIQSLSVEAKANAENAKVEIVGNDELKSGTNEITIKVSVTDEAGLEEQKTYTIKVQKEEEPVVVELTTIQKIQNFFGGFGSGITKWISSNFDKIITGMLLISTSAFVGLTIYFAFDYKNYQKLLAKLASYNKENLMERANVALKPENSTVEEVQNIEEKEDKKAKLEEFIKNDEDEQEEKAKIKTARGKRFK